MNRQGIALLLGGTALLLLAAAGFRLARVNYLGGVPQAEDVEACLHALHREPGNSGLPTRFAGLGTAAIPTVTNYLCFRESGFRRRLREFVNRNGWFHARVFGENDYQEMALSGALLLPVEAAPHLVALFAGEPLRYADDSVARRVDRVLGRLGEAVVPAVQAGLHARDAAVRGHCALAIANHDDLRDVRVVPDLAACARDPSPKVRAAVMLALGRVLAKADVSVPALAKGLADDESAVRFHAVHSLWAFGSEAKPALPALADAIARESLREDAGMDEQPLGAKSQEAILYALTNAYQTIREHGD